MTAATERAARLEDRYGAVAAETRLLPVPVDDRVGVVAFEYRGPAARVLAGIFGAVAVAHAAAVTGSVSTIRTVVLAAATPAHADAVGRNGAVSVGEEIPGQTAEAAAVAQAGTITAIRNTALAGPVAIAYAIAPAGVTSAAGNTSITGAVATADADTPAGIVDTIRHTSIEAPTAVADAAAEPGTITAVRNLTITGTVATATADAAAGVVEFVIHATITGQVATATAAGGAGVVTTTSNSAIAGTAATVDAVAPAGVIVTTSNAAIGGFVANATVTAHPGVAQAVRNTSVAGVVASAAATAFSGTVDAVIAFARQKMNQTSTIGDPSGNKVKVPMTSDTTYPATVVDSVMTVVGGGIANVVLNVNGSGGVFANVRLTLEQNGVAIGSVDIANNSNARTATISAALASGDLLALYAQRISAGAAGGEVRGASVDVVPFTPPETPTFEKIVGVQTGTGTATASLTTLPSTLIIFATANGIEDSTLTVDDVTAIPHGTEGKTRMWVVPVDVGPHTVTLSDITSTGTLVVASYLGVTGVGAFGGNTGSGGNTSVSLPGSGALAVAAVAGPYAAYPAWSGIVSGTERIRQENSADASNGMAVAEWDSGAPSYSNGSSWTEVSVWLS